MPEVLLYAVLGVTLLSASVALFFFTLTRGALLVRAWTSSPADRKSHVYPIYSNMRLIRLIDHQPIISAILLFQYRRMVRHLVAALGRQPLAGRRVLITSCAFGNVIPEVVNAALDGGAARVLIADIIENELVRARSKLAGLDDRVGYIAEDATDMHLDSGSVDANVMFFLLHELPHPLKRRALDEAMRVLAPGGTLLLAEFHRPEPRLLRALSWAYFKLFEPYGLALWGSDDPADYFARRDGWSCERTTFCFGNFQVVRATRL